MSKTHTINNNDFLGSLVDGSLGGEVISTSSLDSGLVNGDNGTVGVGNKAVAVASAVAVRSNSSSSVESASKAASSSEVVSTGSSHGRLVGRDDSTVGVGDKVGVQVEGTSVAVSRGVGGGSSVANGSNRGGVGNRDSSNGGISHKRPSSELGGEMVGLQGGHTGLVDGGDGTVGVALQTEEALGGGEGETGGENLKENFDSLFTLSLLVTFNSPETSWCIWLCARAQTEES